jgi:O-acetyl-ADP-ribose deacetylase (regulator of RNase III)
MIQLTLCSYEYPDRKAVGFKDVLGDAYQAFCGDLACVKVYQGSILDVDCHAVVLPINSFGFMDGSLGALYTKQFGPDLQVQIQQKIKKEYFGELLVGQAFTLPTGNTIPYIVIAPTMRVPMILPADTVNPYLALKAVLNEVTHYGFRAHNFRLNPGESVRIAVPGFGTGIGIGRVKPEICARQFRLAIEDVIYGQRSFPSTSAEALLWHSRI